MQSTYNIIFLRVSVIFIHRRLPKEPDIILVNLVSTTTMEITLLGLHENCPTFLSSFNQIWNFHSLHIKFNGNRFNASRSDTSR
jgi:hypothetical protein